MISKGWIFGCERTQTLPPCLPLPPQQPSIDGEDLYRYREIASTSEMPQSLVNPMNQAPFRGSLLLFG